MVTAPAINCVFTAGPVLVFNKITLFLMWISFTGGPGLCILESELNTHKIRLFKYFLTIVHTRITFIYTKINGWVYTVECGGYFAGHIMNL